MQQASDAFLTTQEAVELIKAHTNENPVVDLRFMVVNRDYIEKGHLFTIKLLTKKDGQVVEGGVVYATIRNDRDKYTLREEIKEAYSRNYNLELNLDERPTREVTSVVDPQTNPKGNPMLDNSTDAQIKALYTPDRNTRIS